MSPSGIGPSVGWSCSTPRRRALCCGDGNRTRPPAADLSAHRSDARLPYLNSALATRRRTRLDTGAPGRDEGIEVADEGPARSLARLRGEVEKGAPLASTLVGLGIDAATTLAREHGYELEDITSAF